jgi:hypothetical protein
VTIGNAERPDDPPMLTIVPHHDGMDICWCQSGANCCQLRESNPAACPGQAQRPEDCPPDTQCGQKSGRCAGCALNPANHPAPPPA